LRHGNTELQGPPAFPQAALTGEYHHPFVDVPWHNFAPFGKLRMQQRRGGFGLYTFPLDACELWLYITVTK
jgi:hypothetical protein